jgi:glycolate oxidase FAD binding subunit
VSAAHPAADPAALAAYAVGGVAPAAIATPADAAALAACVAETAARGAALVALGRGAHREIGHPPARYDLALSTARLARVLEYTPADMTVSVESGVPLAELQALLACERQWLPLDPPCPEATTVGGLVAADLGGPLTASQGRVRDFLIGVAVVTADGRCGRGGGKVVKNVAGYDLMKLFTGSLGTLAVVTAATFKVRPRPETTRALACEWRAGARALALASRLATGALAPLAATLEVPLGGAPRPASLLCLLGGVAEAVAAERARVLALVEEEGGALAFEGDGEDPPARTLLAAARDFPRAAPGAVAARLAVLPARAAALAADLGATFDRTRGRARLDPRAGLAHVAIETSDPARSIEALRAVAATHGARLVVERWPAELAATIAVWSPLPSAFPLMRRMKAALDPRGTLAPGRFVGRI